MWRARRLRRGWRRMKELREKATMALSMVVGVRGSEGMGTRSLPFSVSLSGALCGCTHILSKAVRDYEVCNASFDRMPLGSGREIFNTLQKMSQVDRAVSPSLR